MKVHRVLVLLFAILIILSLSQLTNAENRFKFNNWDNSFYGYARCSLIIQMGSFNFGEIYQLGNKHSYAEIIQKGDGNIAKIIQTKSNISTHIHQYGHENNLSLDLHRSNVNIKVSQFGNYSGKKTKLSIKQF